MDLVTDFKTLDIQHREFSGDTQFNVAFVKFQSEGLHIQISKLMKKYWPNTSPFIFFQYGQLFNTKAL